MIAFLQALGVAAYCSLISLIFWCGEAWFGHVPNFFGPLLMLTLLSASALICGLLVFFYPIKLFLKTKKFESPLKIVFQTAVWLAVFGILLMLGIMTLK